MNASPTYKLTTDVVVRKIETKSLYKNYSEYLLNCIDKFLTVNKITQEEYDSLKDLITNNIQEDIEDISIEKDNKE